MTDSTPCNLDIAFRLHERPERDGCVFLLHRSADGRRLAKGRFLPDGSLEIRDGAVPDKPNMAALTEAALAFQKSDDKRQSADACKAAFAKAFEPKSKPAPELAKVESSSKPEAESKPKRKATKKTAKG